MYRAIVVLIGSTTFLTAVPCLADVVNGDFSQGSTGWTVGGNVPFYPLNYAPYGYDTTFDNEMANIRVASGGIGYYEGALIGNISQTFDAPSGYALKFDYRYRFQLFGFGAGWAKAHTEVVFNGIKTVLSSAEALGGWMHEWGWSTTESIDFTSEWMTAKLYIPQGGAQEISFASYTQDNGWFPGNGGNSGGTSWLWIDNVRLVPVPEPSALVLALLGALALTFHCQRSWKKDGGAQ